MVSFLLVVLIGDLILCIVTGLVRLWLFGDGRLVLMLSGLGCRVGVWCRRCVALCWMSRFARYWCWTVNRRVIGW